MRDIKEIDCVWQPIYDRLKDLNQLDRLLAIQPPKDWSWSRDGGLENDKGGFDFRWPRVILNGSYKRAILWLLGNWTSQKPDANFVLKKAELLKGYADAFNITDNQTAIVRMSILQQACW